MRGMRDVNRNIERRRGEREQENKEIRRKDVSETEKKE